MKKYLPFIALSFTLSCFSQNPQGIRPCNTYGAMEQYFNSNPEARKNYEVAQQQLRAKFIESKAYHISGKAAAFEYTVPVVFHVLHTGGPENVSDATCVAALATVNNDFARTGGDANTVAAPFNGLYINSDIKFMLAKKDPGGNCTNGIVHHYDARTVWNNNCTGITWDPTKYLNVIVVKIIGDGSTIGYTWLPGTWGPGDEQDAIVYAASFLNGLDARSLSHEIGHWLNLNHTFGATNDPELTCGDDGLSDTPPTKGTYACPNSLSGNVCNGGGTNNVENFMDYSSCPKNFTTDQTNVMRTALTSAPGLRNNLWSPANLAATDVDGITSCAPVCEFLSTTDVYTVCSGGSLTMKDCSYNGVITSYSWTGSGATIVSPSASITLVSFPTPGTSIITLTVTNAQGTSTKTRFVTVVNGAPGVPNNYSESFEAVGLPAGWQFTNVNPGSVSWAQTNLGASHGVNSYFIDGPVNPPNHIDYLEMPVIDILNNPNNLFTFKYAYAKSTPSTNDALKVQVSVNCGGIWQDLVDLSASTMAGGSGGTIATPYVPVSAEWKLYDVTQHPNWFNFTTYSSVMVRFMFKEDASGFANRLYLDEVNFSDPNGVNELTKSIHFNLYPNPAKGEACIKFSLNDPANIKINIVDVLGKNVLPEMNYDFNPGEKNISINKNNILSKGIYFVNLSYNGTKMSRKLVID